MPPPAEIPHELKSYYASLTMEPSDVLSFGYQIASGMVSKSASCLLLYVCRSLSLIFKYPGVPDRPGNPAQGPGKQEYTHDCWKVPEGG